MKFLKEGTAFFLIAMVPLNIIYIIKFVSIYYSCLTYQFWVVLSVYGLLIIIGCLFLFVFLKQDIKPVKNQLGEFWEIKSVTNITGEQYLTQYSLFILMAFVMPETLPILDGIIMFVLQLTIWIVYVSNEMFFINPLLNIIGYKTFKVECKLENSFKPDEEANMRTLYIFTKNMDITNLEHINMRHTDFNILIWRN